MERYCRLTILSDICFQDKVQNNGVCCMPCSCVCECGESQYDTYNCATIVCDDNCGRGKRALLQKYCIFETCAYIYIFLDYRLVAKIHDIDRRIKGTVSISVR